MGEPVASIQCLIAKIIVCLPVELVRPRLGHQFEYRSQIEPFLGIGVGDQADFLDSLRHRIIGTKRLRFISAQVNAVNLVPGYRSVASPITGSIDLGPLNASPASLTIRIG